MNASSDSTSAELGSAAPPTAVAAALKRATLLQRHLHEQVLQACFDGLRQNARQARFRWHTVNQVLVAHAEELARCALTGWCAEKRAAKARAAQADAMLQQRRSGMQLAGVVSTLPEQPRCACCNCMHWCAFGASFG